MVAPRRRVRFRIGWRSSSSAVLGAILLLTSASAPAASMVRHRSTAVVRAGSIVPSAPVVVLPVAAPIDVVRPFANPAHDWSAGHRGVDLGVDAGALVVSPVDGVVTFAGTVVDRGVVTVQDARGVRSSVEPVSPLVHAGESIRHGEAIATLMAGHCGARSCVHWGIRVGSTYIDPLDLLRPPARIVLLPIPVTRASP